MFENYSIADKKIERKLFHMKEGGDTHITRLVTALFYSISRK